MAARLVPLGGLGEFGANSLLVEGEEEEAFLLDAGAAFSELDVHGVAYEVPDFSHLSSPRPTSLVLTHAHDDHAKGAALAAEALSPLKLVASPGTLARVRRALADVGPLPVEEIGGRRALEIGSFTLDGLPVSHSIPGTLAVRVSAAHGAMVLASDLRLAPSALGETTSVEDLARWGSEGVELLLLDATNVLVAGDLPFEAAVASCLGDLVAKARGAVVAVTFASHLGRFVQLARAAIAAGRVVVPVGRGLEESLQVHADVGANALPPGSVRPARALASLAREQVVIVATGSQGEPGSGFARVASDLLPGFKLAEGDLVVHAARIIPGSERRLNDLFDACVRRGARVVTANEAPTHVSGHPPPSELDTLLELLRPRFVLPVHGRRRHLEALASLARRHGCTAVVVDNGAEVAWAAGSVAVTGRQRGVGRVLYDEAGEGQLDSVVVRCRRSLARNGVVVAVLVRRPGASDPPGDPTIQSCGVSLPANLRDVLASGLGEELRRAVLGWAQRAGEEELRSTMIRWLRSELRRRLHQRPTVVAMVVER